MKKSLASPPSSRPNSSLLQRLQSKSFDAPLVINPFYAEQKIPWYRVLQIILMSVTLAPLRLIFAVLLLLLVGLVTTIVTCGLPRHQSVPLAGWRKNANGLIKFLLYAVLFCFGFHWIRVKGKIAPTSEAAILSLAPHTSFFDVIGGLVYGLHSGVARIENANTPLIGRVFRFAQVVMVDRQDPDSRVKTVQQLQERSQSGGLWPRIAIFPEGTCTGGKALICFKQGAFIPGEPVQPVCIRYNNSWDTYSWTPGGRGASCGALFWMSLCQFHNSVTVTFLPVYSPSAEEQKNALLFANNVRSVMARELGVEVTDHSYEDCRLMVLAEKQQLPAAAGLVEFQKLNRKIGLSMGELEDLLRKFGDMAGEKGQMAFAQFSDHLGLPMTPALKELFNLYDRDRSGKIDFREYAIGLTMISRSTPSDDVLKEAFQLFDRDGVGEVDGHDLQMILEQTLGCSPEESDKIFEEVDSNKDGIITYDEFLEFTAKRPEYMRLIKIYQNLRSASSHGESESDWSDVGKEEATKVRAASARRRHIESRDETSAESRDGTARARQVSSNAERSGDA